MSDGGRSTNRLINETSPYLLQHAHNPVDWYAWGEEAIQKAKSADRPLFLSIGYSACHWCHVMEHESFEDDEIAALMNGYFVNVKVDREERPDLDQIYMSSVTAMTGRGGWPMSVFLTPDLKPFYGGTYWPPEPQRGMPGFRQVIEAVHDAWHRRRNEIIASADELTDVVVRMGLPVGDPASLDVSLMHEALSTLLNIADRRHGGFGRAPKFPHPIDIRLLLRMWKRFDNDDARQVAQLTLDKMAAGGIYDHLGGGFHRYSTDVRWLVPHFEKMLYDNAQLSTAYLEAYQATGVEQYAVVVRETLDYVLREMTAAGGGFYSSQDADSEGEEGKFFVWDEGEITRLLGDEESRLFNYCYDVTDSGNWEGKNILNRVKSHAEAARMLHMDETELAEVLDRSKQRLFAERGNRTHPGRDDKVLTSWNGLMIAAMSLAGRVLGEDRYVDAARSAADFLLETMRGDDGRLLHSYKDDRPRFNAYLDDYACLVDGLTELYQTTFEPHYLTSAVELSEIVIARFRDADGGGFFYTSDDHERLIARTKDSQDGATPSGNGMMAYALLRLGRLCARTDLEAEATRTLETLSGQMARAALASSQALIALDFLIGPTTEVVLVDAGQPEQTNPLLDYLAGRFWPNTVMLRKSAEAGDASLPPVVRPLLKEKHAVQGAPTVYLCEYGTCHAPVIGLEGLKTALGETL